MSGFCFAALFFPSIKITCSHQDFFLFSCPRTFSLGWLCGSVSYSGKLQIIWRICWIYIVEACEILGYSEGAVGPNPGCPQHVWKVLIVSCSGSLQCLVSSHLTPSYAKFLVTSDFSSLLSVIYLHFKTGIKGYILPQIMSLIIQFFCFAFL